MSAPDNPRAFPRTGEGMGNPLYDAPGMTLRDYFAGQSITGICPTGTASDEHARNLAAMAYRMADAMLLAREGGQ